MRYTDDKLQLVKTDPDFAERRRLPTLLQLGLSCLVSCGMILTAAMMIDSTALFAFVLLVITGGLTTFCVLTVQRNRDLMLATEFQNALFASALGMNNKFCMIARRDGEIVYLDRGFQLLFPDFRRITQRNIDVLLEVAQVAKEESQKVIAAIDRGAFSQVRFSLRAGDGATHNIMLTIEPINRPVGFLLLRGRDYVEKRHGAKDSAGADAAALPFPALHQLPVCLYMADSTGKLTYANPRLEHWLGYEVGEMVAQNFELKDLLRDSAFNVLTPGEGEVMLKNKAGGLVAAYVQQEATSDASSQLVGFSGVVQPLDVAGLKKKIFGPELNEDSAHHLAEYILRSPIAIAYLDEKGTLLEGNPAFHVLTQRTLTGAGISLPAIIGEGKRKEFEAALKNTLKDNAPPPLSVELALPSGAKPIVSFYFNRVPAAEGPPRLLVHLIDTTEQKNLEMRFAHSQKMQAVGQLAGGVAHDFNNLLTAMIGFCDLLLMRHPAGDQSFADIMQVKQNANRAANLVRQLLAFSRRQTLQPKLLSITDVLAELSNLIRRLIGENIELKMTHGRDVGTVKADQGQLEQVLINLAVNARDAMKKGGALSIQTSLRHVDAAHPLPPSLVAPSEEDTTMPAGDYVLIEVSDTGHGIPRELLQKIFEPFFSTKEVGSGTGLGLATCYGIIKQTGGYIFVSSDEGKGTIFSLFFPSQGAQEASAVTENEVSEKLGGVDLTGKGTILLVEDETPVRVFAGRALRNKGYTVLEADCGETGLSMMAQHGKDIEVVITDVIMPGINGPAMIEKMIVQYPNIKVIFMSGYAEDVFKDSYGSERSFNFLPKPFTLKQLAGKVKEVAMGKA